MIYIHDKPDWPAFQWSADRLATRLAQVRHKQGRLLGRMESLGCTLRAEASLQALTEDVVKSREIEGETLDRNQVRSSIARRLGIDIGALTPAERNVEGVVDMTLDATQKPDQPITAERLFGWHAALFPTGRSGLLKIVVAGWRTEQSGAMQVVSGPVGREHIHFEAPAAERLDEEMRRFLDWFNADREADPVIKAAVAHLWFVTIRPFEDGNGRIARVIADLALARSEETTQRFYSMSSQIRKERNAYYDMLERTQRGTLDITDWLQWFLDCLDRAFDGAETIMGNVLDKARFWERHGTRSLNDRQRLMLNRLIEGFEGKLTSSKWAQFVKVSQATAARDIEDLIDKGILQRDAAGGRSTSYSLVP
ncbi:Fic family protein [Bradyrhizobium monzae]|uniref:Fic family protein n=1 Tax=Bradyrhizobium sp. Oc8 TaxID=2876780 RepID=UPI001F310AC8|nr:Fic family protein [Bradyrhizobium sp. Oc8]